MSTNVWKWKRKAQQQQETKSRPRQNYDTLRTINYDERKERRQNEVIANVRQIRLMSSEGGKNGKKRKEQQEIKWLHSREQSVNTRSQIQIQKG